VLFSTHGVSGADEVVLGTAGEAQRKKNHYRPSLSKESLWKKVSNHLQKEGGPTLIRRDKVWKKER